MPLQKSEHGIEDNRVAGARTQIVGDDARQRHEAFGTFVVGQDPRQRLKRDGDRPVAGLLITLSIAYRHVADCFRRSEELRDVAKKVLIVEDNELNLRLFCDLLRAHDYAVEGLRDGREALATARSFQPDLIIMDIQMPHVTGVELIVALRQDPEICTIPVMAVTAYAGKADEDRVRAAGADAYVSKPISLIRFIDTVSSLLHVRPVVGAASPDPVAGSAVAAAAAT